MNIFTSLCSPPPVRPVCSAISDKTYATSQPPDTRSHLHQTQMLRELYVQNFPKRAPSSQGLPSAFAELQRDKRPPSAASSIRRTLLHPISSRFIDDCEKYEPTAADNKLVLKLSTAMSGFFEELT